MSPSCVSEVHKYGILETDDTERVTGFLEKPQPTETDSRKEVCYTGYLPLLFQGFYGFQFYRMKVHVRQICNEYLIT